MKLCRFGDDRLGVVIGDRVHDVTSCQDEIRRESPYAMKGDAVIAALPRWRDKIQKQAASVEGKPLASVALLSPVARPLKTMAAPANYMSHGPEMFALKAQMGGTPTPQKGIAQDGIFLKANSALVGASEGIPLRFLDRRNDHEAEVVIIIGREGTNISQANALDYVAGYALGLDMTIRGSEDRSFRKSCDGYAVLGPYIVTADEIKDPDNLPFQLSVNGEPRQNANTKDMTYSIRKLIELASSFYTLHPGDVYYTGTPGGVGPVRPGDKIRIESAVLGAMDVAVRAHAV